jgi:phage I-like protein
VVAKQKVAGILGLNPEATFDEIEAGITAAKSVAALRSDLITALGLDANASNEAIKAAVVTAKSGAGELPKLAARVQELEAANFEDKFNGVIAKAFQGGKILPVQRDDEKWMASQKAFAKSSMAEFEAFWEKQPVIGPVNKLPVHAEKAGRGAFTEEDLLIAKQLQVPIETLRKYNAN